MSLSFTKKTDYAIVALVVLSQETSEGGAWLSARAIAESCALPVPTLMKILKILHRQGIVCGRRGAAGGYHLCRKAQDISLREIVEAIEGPIQLTACCDESVELDDLDCSSTSQANCPIVRPVRRLNKMMGDFLDQVKLSHLIGTSVEEDPNRLVCLSV